ncbi:hypothetical protein [Herminiimonas sp. CN]|uniref:hypothetical protein n=1 Tax=Herminiimonas sp. CN TaxID=1349818 RepID=UPI001EE6638C|nr:hypothetical protein [Herminiimonas sp. CN]
MSPKPVAWMHLLTPVEAEAWIDNFNRDLQQCIRNVNAGGYGVCFSLAEGGDIYLHTTSEGHALLDVTPDAQWAAPVIAAAANVPQPNAQIWHFPDANLVQFVLGLSSLVASTTMVLRHDFNRKQRRSAPER